MSGYSTIADGDLSNRAVATTYSFIKMIERL